MNSDVPPEGWAEPDAPPPAEPPAAQPRGEPPAANPPYAQPPGGPPAHPPYGPPPGEPPAAQPPYGQAPAAHGPYGRAPGGYWRPPGDPSPPPHARKRHAKLIVGLCAALVLILLAVEVTLEVQQVLRGLRDPILKLPTPTPSAVPPASPNAVPHSLTIPASFAAYVRTAGAAAQVCREARRADPAAGRLVAKAKIAVYRKKGEPRPRMLFVALSAAADPAVVARDALRLRGAAEH